MKEKNNCKDCAYSISGKPSVTMECAECANGFNFYQRKDKTEKSCSFCVHESLPKAQIPCCNCKNYNFFEARFGLERNIIDSFCKKQKNCESCPLDNLRNEDANGYCPSDIYYELTEEKFEKIFEIIKNNTSEQEEINHPDRYANGKYECIDVMVDVFGVEATKAFCKLNAFKYLWREERKNGLQDVKKAAWYINKYIELSESGDEENV